MTREEKEEIAELIEFALQPLRDRIEKLEEQISSQHKENQSIWRNIFARVTHDELDKSKHRS